MAPTSVRLLHAAPAPVPGIVYNGVQGAAWVTRAVSLLTLLAMHFFIRSVIHVCWVEHAGVLWRPVLASCVMAWAVRAFLNWAEHDLGAGAAIQTLAVAVLVGACAYVPQVAISWGAAGRPHWAENYGAGGTRRRIGCSFVREAR